MLSKKDILVIVSIAFFFLLTGACIGFFMAKHEPVEPLDNSKYIRAIDSLNVLNKANKDSITAFYKAIRVNDSLSLLNIKKLTHDKKIINNLSANSLRNYLDSIFKVPGH